MKKLLLTISCVAITAIATAQSTYFNATGGELINQNAIMPSDSGIYFCMQKSNNTSSLYWLQNNALTEIKSLGTNLQGVVNNMGSTPSKAYFTFGKKALFVVADNNNNQKIWITDGTPAGTDTLRSLASGLNVIYIAGMIGNELYYTITTANSTAPLYSNSSIYKTNFTTAGTVLIREIPNSNLSINYIDNGKMYANGPVNINNGNVLYEVLTDTTRILKASNWTVGVKVFNGNMYVMNNGVTKTNLTTNLTNNISPTTVTMHSPNFVGAINNKLIFQGNLNTSFPVNAHLFVIDSTSSNLTELTTNTGASVTLLENTYAVGNAIIYFIGRNANWHYSLYSTDGTSANTRLIQELDNTTLAISTPLLKLCNDQLYYYSDRYYTGTTKHTPYTLSTCSPTSDSLTTIQLTITSNDGIRNIENFEDKLIYNIYSSSITLDKLYAINACSSAPLATNSLQDYNTITNTSIYPNPNIGTFTLHTTTNATVVIYNVLGERVYTTTATASTTQVALSLTAGVYVAKIISATGTSTNKFIVE